MIPPQKKKIEERGLSTTIEEAVSKRINHITFCRMILWIEGIAKNGTGFFYTSDLASFLKTSSARSHSLIREWIAIGLLRKGQTNSLATEYHPAVDEFNIPRYKKYLEKAKETLKKSGFKIE